MEKFFFMFINKEAYDDPKKDWVSIPSPDYVGVIHAKDHKEADERIRKHMPKGYKLGITNITKIDSFLINLSNNTPTLI